MALELMGTVRSGFGDPEAAAALFGAGRRLRDLLGAPLPEAELEAYESRLAEVRKGLEAARFEAAWERGHAMPAPDAVEYALGLGESVSPR